MSKEKIENEETEQEQEDESVEQNPILQESGYCGYGLMHPVDESKNESEDEDESEEKSEEQELEQLKQTYEVYQKEHKELPKTLSDFIAELKIEIEEE